MLINGLENVSRARLFSCCQAAVVIQSQMQFEGRLLRRDIRPGKDLHRQIDQRAIQGKQLALEPEPLARHGTTGLQPRVQQPEEFLEEVGVEPSRSPAPGPNG